MGASCGVQSNPSSSAVKSYEDVAVLYIVLLFHMVAEAVAAPGALSTRV